MGKIGEERRKETNKRKRKGGRTRRARMSPKGRRQQERMNVPCDGWGEGGEEDTVE